MQAKVELLAGVVRTKLNPGKRGEYALTIFDIGGWDPTRDAAIEVGDACPEKPTQCRAPWPAMAAVPSISGPASWP
jgi:hypothetical protein